MARSAGRQADNHAGRHADQQKVVVEANPLLAALRRIEPVAAAVIDGGDTAALGRRQAMTAHPALLRDDALLDDLLVAVLVDVLFDVRSFT